MIYDSRFNELKDPDLSQGKLINVDRIVAHHEATPAQTEQWHYELMPGTDGLRRKVVDAVAVDAKEAWDEYVTVQVFVPYTEEQLKREEAN